MIFHDTFCRLILVTLGVMVRSMDSETVTPTHTKTKLLDDSLTNRDETKIKFVYKRRDIEKKNLITMLSRASRSLATKVSQTQSRSMSYFARQSKWKVASLDDASTLDSYVEGEFVCRKCLGPKLATA